LCGAGGGVWALGTRPSPEKKGLASAKGGDQGPKGKKGELV